MFKPLIAFLAMITMATFSHAKDKHLPNILLIMVDDLGYGDLSSYGSKMVQTPEIDKLVESGMKFTEFYANCTVCSPTRAALLSGRYPEFVGIPGVVRTRRNANFGYLSPDSIMLPTLFQKAGYHTSLIGKWHLGLLKENRPNQRGFDFFHGFLGDMMDDYWKHLRHGIHYMRKNEELITPDGHATDLFTQWAIDELKVRKTEDKPFFMFLAYNAPHSPIHPPKDWVEKVKEREPELPKKRINMIAFIEHLDYGIGQVLAELKSLDLEKETIVIFTSDNGGALHYNASNGNLRGGKTSMYEGGLKVTTAFSWPGHIKPGSTTAFHALTMDILPTLADIAGIPIEHEIDGRSFKQQLLKGTQDAFTDPVFHMWFQRHSKEAVRLGDWKLLRDRHNQPLELYNIKEDPREKNNVIADYPEKTEELHELLKAHMARANKVPRQRKTEPKILKPN